MATGGAGIEGGAAWWTKDEEDWNTALDAQVASIPDLDQADYFLFETKFRIHRQTSGTSSNFFYSYDIYGSSIFATVEFDDDVTPFLELELGEAGSTQHIQLLSSVGIVYDTWYYLTWEHDVPNGTARAKLWRDGMPEPDWQALTTPYDYRSDPRFPPSFIIYAYSEVSGTGYLETDWTRTDWDYIRFTH